MARAINHPSTAGATAGATSPHGHAPVLLESMLRMLAPRDGEIYVDATFGRGGYSQAILDSANCQVIGLDRDPSAKAASMLCQQRYPERFSFMLGRFSQLDDLLRERGLYRGESLSGIVFDYGVSSPQLDEAERGFSLRLDGPLDMRMSQDGPTASDIVNRASENELLRIFRDYGEEPRAKSIAKAIINARRTAQITRTKALTEIIQKSLMPSAQAAKNAKLTAIGLDTVTRCFQALRIEVNQELSEIEAGLKASRDWLRPGGRLVAVSFHSLEDRLVKRFMRDDTADHVSAQQPQSPSRHHPPSLSREATPRHWQIITKSPLTAAREEIRANPRSRSAKLRAALKLSDACSATKTVNSPPSLQS